MSLSLSHTQMCISRYLFKQIGNKICFCDNEDNHSDQDVDEYHDDGDEYHMMKFSCNLRAGPNDSGDAEAAKSKGFSTFFLAEHHPAPGRILSLGFIVRWLPCCADFYRRARRLCA